MRANELDSRRNSIPCHYGSRRIHRTGARATLQVVTVTRTVSIEAAEEVHCRSLVVLVLTLALQFRAFYLLHAVTTATVTPTYRTDLVQRFRDRHRIGKSGILALVDDSDESTRRLQYTRFSFYMDFFQRPQYHLHQATRGSLSVSTASLGCRFVCREQFRPKGYTTCSPNRIRNTCHLNVSFGVYKARNLSPPTSTERHASAESRHPTKSELSSRDCATCRGYNLKASAVTRIPPEDDTHDRPERQAFPAGRDPRVSLRYAPSWRESCRIRSHPAYEPLPPYTPGPSSVTPQVIDRSRQPERLTVLAFSSSAFAFWNRTTAYSILRGGILVILQMWYMRKDFE